MHISSCEQPKYINNKYSGELVSCHCGHCASCLNSKAASWIQRLDDESRLHRYCFMFTLTYDNEHLPRLGVNDDCTKLVSLGREDVDLCIPFSELQFDSDSDYQYLRERLEHPLGLPIYYPKDFSKFFKRLNKYLFKHVTGKYENFRYFLCGEYGPSTFRCHAHGMLFFDDSRIEKCIQKAISSCWSFGDATTESVYSHGGKSYVAQYVNMSMHLPSFYRHKNLRQRCQFSKSPAIGSLQLSREEVRIIYDEKPIERIVFNPQSKKYVLVPVYQSIKNRYFPKCLGYSDLSHSDRVKLYGICDKIPSQGFEEFRYSTDLLFWLYDRKICNKTERFLAEFLMNKKIESQLYKSDFDATLRHVYAVSKRVCMFSSIFNTSVDWLVTQIEEFYKKLDYANLKKMYEFQQDYSKSHRTFELAFMYPNFVDAYNFYNKYPKVNYEYWYQMAFDSFGFDMLNPPQLQDCMEYKSMVSKALKIYKDTHKGKDVHNYLYSKKAEIIDKPLTLILKRYFKNKTLWQKEM